MYDPRSQQLVPLTPIPDELQTKFASMDFVGPMLANDEAVAIAEGNMDPITSVRFSAPVEQQQNPPRMTAASFIQRRPTPAAATKAAPVTQKKTEPAAALNNFRHLPSSFMRKSTPLPAFAPPPPVRAARTIPSPTKRISRFFASSVKQCSQSETDDSSLPASSFESQEADVPGEVSFSPLEDAVKHKQRGEKEHHAPRSKPIQDNAFARMMRAGSLLQKQSLKRKAIGGSTFHGRKAQMVSKSPLELIQQHAYKPEHPNVDHCSTDTNKSTESPEVEEPEAETCSSNQDQEKPESIAQPVKLPLQMATRSSTRSSITSLDRFRFNK